MSSKILGSYPEKEELKKERRKCSFPVKELTFFLEGDEEKTVRRKELEKLFYEDPAFADQEQPVDYMTYDGIYEEALMKAHKMYFKALNLADPREVLAIGEAFHQEATPLLLHFIMFIPALLGHGTEDQISRWLPDAIELKVIGTYAQTELGHGTYIRGLQTKATYDPEKEEFLLESPTLESIKWWPGGLGKTANWAIVLAQLHTQGIPRGIHPFMVNIRDVKTHKPQEGIVVGEIGPRMGLKAADNGFLQLNQVRIPRKNMLMRNSRVERNGDYIRPKSEKLNYGTMVFVRVVLIDMVAFNLAKALTISIRYSAVRRQAEIEKGKGEVQILDYKAQQYKLLPLLSMAHAFKASFVALMTGYKDVTEQIEKGDLDKMGQLHAMSSGLKALSSDMGSAAIEKCRLACGGHGYLLISGLPRIYAATVAACTYEGENTVLYLQTARYLLKRDPSAGRQETTSSESAVNYLQDEESPQVISGEHLIKTFPGLLSLYRASAYRSLEWARKRLEEAEDKIGRGAVGSRERAWIECQVDLITGAKCHLLHFLMCKYVHWVGAAPASLQPILSKLCFLFLYFNILENPGEYLLVGLTEDELNSIKRKVSQLLEEIRPDAVSLVDAFDFHDVVLMSALGCFDGAVYERLFEMAKKAPLNREDPHPAYIKHIQSLVKSKL